MTKSRRWLIICSLSAAMFVGAYLALAYFYFATPQYSLWIDRCMQKKEAYAKSLDVPKIAFLSGSNALFGVRSADVEQHFGIPSVNLAIHYGLQIDYILERAKASLRNGDLVILPLEYAHYSYDGGYRTIQSFYVRTYDKDYFRSLQPAKALRHLINTTPIDFIKALREQVRFDGQERAIGEGYTSETLNRHGDETFGPGPRWDRLKRVQPIAVPARFELTYGVERILEFRQWCLENGIFMALAFPNVIDLPEHRAAPFLQYIEAMEKFFAERGIDFVGEYEGGMLPDDLFFDGVYHLNQDGITMRTQRIIAAMEKDAATVEWLSRFRDPAQP